MVVKHDMILTKSLPAISKNYQWVTNRRWATRSNKRQQQNIKQIVQEDFRLTLNESEVAKCYQNVV